MTIKVTIKHEEPNNNKPISVIQHRVDDYNGHMTVIKPGAEQSFHVHNYNALTVTEGVNTNQVPSVTLPVHSDDAHIDYFASLMKDKMRASREKGYGNWDTPDECSNEYLAKLFLDRVEEGDFLDAGIYAMMLHARQGTEAVTTELLMRDKSIGLEADLEDLIQTAFRHSYRLSKYLKMNYPKEVKKLKHKEKQ
jgi:hypothetical protein